MDEVNQLYWGNQPRELIDPIIDQVVVTFKQLPFESQVKCKSSIKSYLRIYPFLAAIIPYRSIEWEKLNTFYMLLVHKLPTLKGEDLTIGLIESIDFDQYRLIKGEEQHIQLTNESAEIEPIPVGSGKGPVAPDMHHLSSILDEFNQMFGGIQWEHPEQARAQLEQLPERLYSDPTFVNAALNSNREVAQLQCNTSLMNIVATLLAENTEFCRNYFDNPTFMNFINERVFQHAYNKVNNM